VASAESEQQALSLRTAIQQRTIAKSALYTFQLDDPVTVPIDFNSSSNNVTNPYEEWKALPDWLRYLSGSILILLGLILTFYGVRFLSFSLFLMGGFIAAVIMYGILGATVSNDDPNKTAIVYGTAFATWILVGVILMCFLSLAVFILGFALGAIVALVLNPIVLKYVWPENPLANTIIWVVVFGIVGGLIAICLKKPLLVVATSAGGAFTIVASAMAMAGQLNIGTYPTMPTTTEEWVAFGGFLLLAAVGILVQIFCTGGLLSRNSEGYQKMN